MRSGSQLITDYYMAHRDELLAFASSRLGDGCLAEDIVQDVFLRLLSSDRLLTEVTLPALVYTITRNLINDYYRRHTTHEQYEHYVKGVCSEVTTMESVFSAEAMMFSNPVIAFSLSPMRAYAIDSQYLYFKSMGSP